MTISAVDPLALATSLAAWAGLGIGVFLLLRLRTLRRRLDRLRRTTRDLESAVMKSWLAARAAHLPGRRASPRPLELRSQFGEDAFLLDLFQDQESGFFIEVGAFDGFTLSVTYAFETLGWTGVLIEPLPHRAEECRRRRPASRVVHAALSRRGSPPTTTFIMLESPGEPADLMSHAAAATGHARRIAGSGARRATVTVPQTTMDAVLEGHTGPIDFAVIDVEGGELDLLDGFDLGRWRPRVLVVEDAGLVEGAGGESPDLIRRVESAGYVRVRRVGPNHAFVRSDEAELIRRATDAVVVS